MSLLMILSRMRRNIRVMLVLLLAISLVSAFFALGPLYLRSISEAALRYTLDTTPPSAFNLRLNNSEPTDLSYRSILDAELGNLVSGVEQTSRSATVFCYPITGEICPGGAQFPYRAYLPIAFSRLTERFTLVDGRFPQASAAPNEIEAVITTAVTDPAHYAIGDRFLLNQPDDPPLEVVIVGLVDPLNRDDPFWDDLGIVVDGMIVDVTINLQRFDFGIIVDEDVFNQQIAPVSRRGNLYQWFIETNTTELRGEGMTSLMQGLERAEAGFRLHYQFADLTGGLFRGIERFQASIAAAEAPVILLSGSVLLLMLFQLVTTVSLILEQESTEWAAITSRGGSISQLVRMQLVTVGILGACAAALGLLLAPLLLIVLEHVGPLAPITGDAPLKLELPPPISILLSLAAALLAVLLLTLPAIPAARSSILRLKQTVSRPPTRPAWARFYLDALLLALGVGLLIRLYFLVGGDAGEGFGALLADPASLIRVLASNPASGLLTDPFNMLGAALLLLGAALLWLRVFPLALRLVGTLLHRLNNLLVPLAVWSVERDPSHYAQLVLLLVGTLALGTASLALNVTHDAGAWEVARYETGDDVSLSFDASTYDPSFDPLELPGVTGGLSLMRYITNEPQSNATTMIFGIDPASHLPATALLDSEPIPLSGITLPADAVEVTLAVSAQNSDAGDPVHTRLTLDLQDAIGVPFTIPMTSADDTLVGEFQTHRAALPATFYPPFRLVGVRMFSRTENNNSFTQTIFIDELNAVNAARGVTTLEDFERVALPEWTTDNQRNLSNRSALFATGTSARAAEGTYSLRVEYSISANGSIFTEPVIIVSRAVGASNPLPVVVSRAFAQFAGFASDRRRPFVAGDEGSEVINLGGWHVNLRYRVVGVIDSFPTTSTGDRFLIANITALRPILNSIAEPGAFYSTNQAWLSINARQPNEAFTDAAAGIPGYRGAKYAWDRYNALRREPLPNAITGVLFAGFWVSLGLGLLDFAFYLAMTTRRRATSFAVLRAMGWNSGKVWGMLTVEQATLVVPALVVGVALGALLAYLLLPFLALLGGETLRIPIEQIGVLLVVLVVSFAILLGVTARAIQRMSLHQVLRLGEE